LKREQDEKHREIYAAKRLGSLKFEENELDLKLSSEITGNLRSLKVSYNHYNLSFYFFIIIYKTKG